MRIVAGAVGLVVLVAGWRTVQVARDLSAVREAAARARDAASTGDLAGVRGAVLDARGHALDAEAGTTGRVWAVLQRLPLVGGDARTVAALAEASARLTAAGLPLVDAVARADGRGALGSTSDGLDVAAVARIAPLLRSAADVAASSLADLGAAHDDRLGPVASGRADAVAELEPAVAGLRRAARVAAAAPTLLGADEERRYLVVVQSNAGVRSLGGYAGSLLEVRVRDGRVVLGRTTTAHAFDGVRYRGLSAATRRVFGTRTAELTQANRVPGVTEVGRQWSAMWAARFDQRVDGVLMLDTVSLGYLVDAVGGVRVDGRTLDGARFRDLVQAGVYRDPDPERQDRLLARAGGAVVLGLRDAGLDAAVLGALRRSVDEERLQWAPQRASVAAAVPATRLLEPADAAVLVDDTVNRFGSKLGRFLRVEVVPGPCGGVTQDARVRLTLDRAAGARSLTPSVTGVARGAAVRLRADVFVLGPRGGAVRGAGSSVGRWQGREVRRVSISLTPGASITLPVRWRPAGTPPVSRVVLPAPALPGPAYRSLC